MSVKIALTLLLISLSQILAQEWDYEFSDEEIAVDASKFDKGLANLLEVYFTTEYMANKTANDLVNKVKVKLH